VFQREKASTKSTVKLGKDQQLKEQNPDFIGVGGCLAQHREQRFHKKVGYLDLFLARTTFIVCLNWLPPKKRKGKDY